MIKILVKGTSAAILLVALVILGACKKDVFTEEDVLKLMQETSYTIWVQEPYTKAGVAGAKVTMIQDGKTVTQETDANGITHFTNVKIGKTHVSVSKDQYLNIDKEVEIKAHSRKEKQEASINLYYIGNDEKITATIRGVVTIQTDLTTEAREVPAGITIEAELWTSDGKLIIPAKVDAAGKFSMNVPVGMDGNSVRLKFPILMYSQKLHIEGSEVGKTTVVNKLTSFNPFGYPANVPEVGSNIAAQGPSGFEWPASHSSYSSYSLSNEKQMERGEVVDLRLDYGTGTVRE